MTNKKSYKAILTVILLLINCVSIGGLFCNAQTTTTQTQTQQVQPLEGFVDSIAEAKKSGQDTTFIFVPAKNNLKMSVLTGIAIMTTQNTLKKKKVKTKLFTLNTTSNDYACIAQKNKLPAIVVLGKYGGQSIVSGKITVAKLLQAYVETSCPPNPQ